MFKREQYPFTQMMTRDIIWKICKNEIQSGEKLSSIEKMAEDYGVARSTIREAIKYMESTGLVYSVHGKGTFVTKYIPSSNGFAFLDHIVQLRQMVELFGVKLAALNRTDKDLKRLAKLLKQMDAEIRYPSRFIVTDREFHLTIAKASGNPFIPNMLENISGLFAGVQDVIVDIPNYPFDNISKDHIKIVEAIRNQDSEVAEKLMSKHLDIILEVTAKNLSYEISK